MRQIIEQLEGLTPGLLTIRAQTVDPSDDGTLIWATFMPSEPTSSIRVQTYTNELFRPTADRREWNQQGRLIPRRVGPLSEVEMVPIESRFAVNEREFQDLIERFGGNFARIADELQLDVESRVDALALANFRRIELDAMTAWANGQIIATDPATGVQQTMALPIAATRYTTAATAWDDGTVNAYDEMLAFVDNAQENVGPIGGLMMRRATANAIKDDAPNNFAVDGGVRSLGAVIESARRDLGIGDFTIVVNERTVDTFSDGGVTHASTKTWPAQKVAAIPAGGRIGSTRFAPVVRAVDISAAEPDAQFDRNGNTVFLEAANGYRSLHVECQINAMPLPNEQAVFVIDAGV